MTWCKPMSNVPCSVVSFPVLRTLLETMTANTCPSKSKGIKVRGQRVNNSKRSSSDVPCTEMPSIIPPLYTSYLKGFYRILLCTYIFERRSTNISTSGSGHLFFATRATSIRGNKHELKLSELTETTAALVFCQMEQNPWYQYIQL